jgi:hypothetical protein
MPTHQDVAPVEESKDCVHNSSLPNQVQSPPEPIHPVPLSQKKSSFSKPTTGTNNFPKCSSFKYLRRPLEKAIPVAKEPVKKQEEPEFPNHSTFLTHEEVLTQVEFDNKKQGIMDTFNAMQAANTIVGQAMPVTQGGLTTNGCTVISFLNSLGHMFGVNDRLSDTILTTIIKTMAVPLLFQVRGRSHNFCEWFDVTEAFQSPTIGPSLYDISAVGDKTEDGEFVFGNLFIETHFEELMAKVTNPDQDKTATALLFQGHAISVLKLGKNEGYEVVDSLNTRWCCRNVEAIRTCLQWYAYRHIDYRTARYPATGDNAGDPRQFQALVINPRTEEQKAQWRDNAHHFIDAAFDYVTEIHAADGDLQHLFEYCTSDPSYPQNKLKSIFPQYTAFGSEQEAQTTAEEARREQIIADEDLARRHQMEVDDADLARRQQMEADEEYARQLQDEAEQDLHQHMMVVDQLMADPLQV